MDTEIIALLLFSLYFGYQIKYQPPFWCDITHVQVYNTVYYNIVYQNYNT